MRPIPPPEIQNIQIPKVEKKHEASLFKITLIPGIGALLVVWYGSLLQQATEKRRACSLQRTAECRCRRSLPASRPATTHPACQKVGKQRKEGRLAACSLACFSRSWRKVYSQLSACSSLLSIGRSVHGLTTDHTEDEQTNERADIYGSDACDGSAAKRKQVSFIQKPFSSRGPAAATELVAQGSYCHHYYSPLLVVVHCCCYSGW